MTDEEEGEDDENRRRKKTTLKRFEASKPRSFVAKITNKVRRK